MGVPRSPPPVAPSSLQRGPSVLLTVFLSGRQQTTSFYADVRDSDDFV